MAANSSDTVVLLCRWSTFFLVWLYWERRRDACHSVLPTALNMKATAPPRYEVNDSHAQVRARTVHLLKASCEHIDASIRVIRFSVGDNDINISVKRRREAQLAGQRQQRLCRRLAICTNDWPEPIRDARRFINISDALFFLVMSFSCTYYYCILSNSFSYYTY